MEGDQLPTLIPNRIDRDPSIIRGVTAPELYLIIMIAIPLGLLAVLVFGIIFGSFFLGISFGMFMVILTLIMGVFVISNIKRNKPLNYLSHAWRIKRQKLGFGTSGFIHETTRFKVTR